ncbi:MAG: hypothetical protein ACPLXA_10100 [Moorellaceae bacterium]
MIQEKVISIDIFQELAENIRQEACRAPVRRQQECGYYADITLMGN